MTASEKLNWGAHLRCIRKRSGMLPHELSKETGLNRRYISQLEQGRHTEVRASTIYKLAKALNVTMDYLWCGKKKIKRSQPCRKT